MKYTHFLGCSPRLETTCLKDNQNLKVASRDGTQGVMVNYRGERETQGQTCLPPPLPPHPPLSCHPAAAGVFSGQRSEVKG